MLTDAPEARALFAAIFTRTFDELGVSVSLRADEEWHAIHTTDSVIRFERDFSVYLERLVHNERCFEGVRRERKSVVDAHAGFSDLFVPVADRELRGVLVAGPFALERPSSSEVSQRWRALGGGDARANDPALLDYTTATLRTLTLEGPLLPRFVRFMECFAALLAGARRVEEVVTEARDLRVELLAARAHELTFGVAASLTDPRTSETWHDRSRADELEAVGLARMPDSALVGLMLPGKEVDPIDEIVRRDAFLRECVALARKRGAISGKVGDFGVALLACTSGGAVRRRSALTELAEGLRALGRRRGLSLPIGVGPCDRGSLVDRYRAALVTAETAGASGLALLHARDSGLRPLCSLAQLRRELGRAVEAEPTRVAALFEKYLTAAAQSTAHRPDALRAALEAGMERAVEALLRLGALDERAFERLESELFGGATSGQGVEALLIAYRSAIADVELVLRSPDRAHRERSVRRALDFIRDHLGGPLSLHRVAQKAGFAPTYFSKLFKSQQGTNLEEYIRSLRVARAKDLLRNTKLGIEQVGRLSGFGKRSFHQVFKKMERLTPLAYRERYWSFGASAHDRGKLRNQLPKRGRSPKTA
jgi:AraC-like DNA-binding protein